jgi:hypothetical protein
MWRTRMNLGTALVRKMCNVLIYVDYILMKNVYYVVYCQRESINDRIFKPRIKMNTEVRNSLQHVLLLQLSELECHLELQNVLFCFTQVHLMVWH